MITVFVKYSERVESNHAMISDSIETFSQVVEVEKLTDLNAKFNNIIDVKVLQADDSSSNCMCTCSHHII